MVFERIVMPKGSFVNEITAEKKIIIPQEILNGLKLEQGDHVEIQIKKIRSKYIGVNVSKNPLGKLLELKIAGK
jgi:bifunctional DNA-binding transcriptional regulator/antitoxin component of YhaV-PrlF toxin-antitoxin module